MATQKFSSFEAFFDAFRFANMRPIILGPSGKNWLLTSVVLNNLSVQWGQAEAKAAVEGTPRPGGVSIFLPTRTPAAWRWNGHRLDELSVMVDTSGSEFCLSAAAAPRSWCGLYIPNLVLAGADGDVTTKVGSKRGVFQVPAQRITRFRSIVGYLEAMVQKTPSLLESAAAQSAACQKLVQEVRELLAAPHTVVPKPGRSSLTHKQIVRLAMDFVEQHDLECISVEQLAIAAGVSERTLRDAFVQYFGLAPVQYLNRRLLNYVRRALLTCDPSRTTVSEVATQFGVWHFGRLARDYQLLFGELPSETLRHLH